MTEGVTDLETNKRMRRINRTIQDAARELGNALSEEYPTPEVIKLSGAKMSIAGEALEYVRAALWSLPPELVVSYKVSSLVEEVRKFMHEEAAEAEAAAATRQESSDTASHPLGSLPSSIS